MGRREQTTERILDGAAAAFAKGGYAGTSMEEIAAAAGVSKLLLYRDFAGKRETYQAIIIWLEHGDPARDCEFYRRLLEVNRSAAKPTGEAKPPGEPS